MRKICFHGHTSHSPDSLIDPLHLVKRCHTLGLTPCVTDHNTIASHAVLKKHLEFIPGEEIRTDKGDLIGLYLTECIPKYTPFLEALDMIKAQGGVSYLPHMYDISRKGVPDPKLASKVDIVEVFNSRCPFNSMNEKADAFAKKHKLLRAVGSDSHFSMEIGNAYVLLDDFDITSPKALLKALKKPRGFHMQKAPFYVRGPTKLVSMIRKPFMK